jgi:hypothetical protein
MKSTALINSASVGAALAGYTAAASRRAMDGAVSNPPLAAEWSFGPAETPTGKSATDGGFSGGLDAAFSSRPAMPEGWSLR